MIALDFDENKTLAVIFDTEWYVPTSDRTNSLASLKVNPAKQGHRFIGGIFSSFPPLKHGAEVEKIEIFVKSLSDQEEERVLKEVYLLFNKYWQQLGEKRDNVPDLITIGTGIARLDIPGLYVRSSLLKIDEYAKLYETYLKTKIVDLSEVAIPYLNKGRPKLLYPVATNSIMRRFGINEDLKSSGKSVWDMADENDFEGIKKRVRGEVSALSKIYWKLAGEIFH